MTAYRLTRCPVCGLVEWPHEAPDKFTSLPCYFEFPCGTRLLAEAEGFGPGWRTEEATDYADYLDGLSKAELTDLIASLTPVEVKPKDAEREQQEVILQAAEL